MEIERKFLITSPIKEYATYPLHEIEQGYLSSEPELRIRKDNDDYFITYKSKGTLTREEYNLPLTETSYNHLLRKVDGNIIKKKRYLIPLNNNLIAQLDVFEGIFAGLMTVEVEFESEEDANEFTPPSWFGKDVTYNSSYKNHNLSIINNKEEGKLCGSILFTQKDMVMTPK